MLYYFMLWLERTFEPPGFQIVQFTTVRSALAAITALTIALFAGRRIIGWLERQQLGERIREGELAGAVDHSHKAGTPTMGGLIILLGVLGSTLLWGAIAEVYVWLILLATTWMGAFGFADDYIKVVRRNKSGLSARIKLAGQISLGLIVGSVLYFHPQFSDIRTLTYMPFMANETLDYNVLRHVVTGIDLGWLIYIPIVTFILTALSNAVNLTDGLDGLAAGVTGIVAVGLIALTYIAGNAVFADFLNEMFLPGTGELTVFASALAASCFGFLWYNGYPAQVFMGDTGALSLGAAVGTMTLMIRKELILPVLCAVFFMETVSVIMQTTYFKATRRRTGTGVRLFRMAPIHHHFEACGIHENKIVVRFWLITAITVIAALLILRIR
ncbi:MAG: phospho-N-acetylmuramoyl-pentapeptide-transferase [Bacteroidetes bacterium CG12_big_fil_rev_8_21_14_0_65_60_17]|nr:MAG: phospho-N-acetylmuramoyl-pentapeptide-transferase [Bacteroidetes bacterium CG12_big_fil_rev_8_21_14_0_65_60_17]